MIVRNVYLQYGKALYEAAVKQNAEEDVLNSLREIIRLSEQREFAEIMGKISILPFEQLKKIVKTEFEGKIHPLTLNLLILLIKNKHFRLISKIFSAYKKAYYRAKDIVEVTVRAARACDESTKKLITDNLQRQLQKNLRFRFEEDNSLIGGLQIYERGYVVDYSIKHYLESLQKYLLQANI